MTIPCIRDALLDLPLEQMVETTEQKFCLHVCQHKSFPATTIAYHACTPLDAFKSATNKNATYKNATNNNFFNPEYI
jgi:hypothetical protein